MKDRRTTIFGLLIRLVRLQLHRIVLWVLFLAVIIIIILRLLAPGPETIRVATFNIQDYPQTPEQAAGAVQLIASLGVDVIGLQEITRPDVLDANLVHYLDDSWRAVHVEQEDVFRRVAILYDDSSLKLLESWSHDETVLYKGGRATLEARFRHRRNDGQALRVFVVHLKAFTAGAPLRSLQLKALQPLVKRAVDSGDKVVMVGDFNSTEISDRMEINHFAEKTGLVWTSEDLECTSYWDRKFTCTGSALDHILSTEIADSVGAGGACKTIGCEPGDSCPAYVKMLSDHCPVTAEF